MIYTGFSQLVTAYLESHLKGKPSYAPMQRVASQWIVTLHATPTRAEVLARHTAKGHGHFQHGSVQANSELALMRAACRWGLYQECWTGGDPTLGIKKWKRPKRKRIGRLDELRVLLRYFDCCVNDAELRDRALIGLQLFTGCRPSEARKARLDAIRPYGEMGCWTKGTTKTGEPHEIPVPWQAMRWLEAWLRVRPDHELSGRNPHLFPGFIREAPITETTYRIRWADLRVKLGMPGLWTYDLRRTLACYFGNELHYDDATIRAVLNHYDGTALSHYYFKNFDSLIKPIQQYADWLCSLKTTPGAEVCTPPPEAVTLRPPTGALRAAWAEYPG